MAYVEVTAKVSISLVSKQLLFLVGTYVRTCKATAYQTGQQRRAEGQLLDFERSGRQIRDK